jgi:predicted lactoylglutathione lyase
MATKIFVNLPVADLARSTEFFTGLGFPLDQRFSDERAGCLIISDDIYAMLLTEPFFQSFTARDIPDTRKTSEAIVALEVDSRQRVDELADQAVGTGGAPAGPPMEEYGMYGRRFADPDGHLWEVFHMDAAAVPAG